MAPPKRPSAITKLSDTDSTGKRNWLIYSKAGDGKTVLAGTAPKALFLTVEAAGTESAKAFGSTADEWVIDSKKELDAVYDYFKRGSGCKDYSWALIDSLSEVEEVFWRHVQGDSNTQRIQDYGTVGTMIRKEVERWNRLPVNVLYTAQTMTLDVEDEDGDESTLLLPSMGTKNGVLSQRICAKTTLNGLLVVRSRRDEDGNRIEQRRLMLRGNKSFVAKDRHLLALERGYIIDPNIADMAQAADRAGERLNKAKKAKGNKEDEDD